MQLNRSTYYYEKAPKLIPGQSQTFSKEPTQFVREAFVQMISKTLNDVDEVLGLVNKNKNDLKNC
jgi:hypothetical protein